MRIDDQSLSNVCFLGHPTKIILEGMTDDDLNDIMHWGGNGFFVHLFSECRQVYFTYLVTAKHVVDGLKAHNVFVRVNRVGGGMVLAALRGYDAWVFHPDTPQEVDVAVMPYLPPISLLDIKAMDPAAWFVTRDVIKNRDIGAGDAVYVIGLFSKMAGREKNIPIVRTGFIASMPDEKIPRIRIGKWRGAAEGYLIESRSISGWSGSPIFVRPTLHVPFRAENEPDPMAFYGVSGKPYLLGLVHGHWDIEPGTENDVHIKAPHPNDEQEQANIGLTVVVPAHKILEVLYHPKLIEMRRTQTEDALRDDGTVPDSEPSAQ